MDSDVALFPLNYAVISWFTCLCALHSLGTTALTWVPVLGVLGLAISQLWSVSAQRQAPCWILGVYGEPRGGSILSPAAGGIAESGSAAVGLRPASFL